MAKTQAANDQFEWDGARLTHKPTGARWAWSYPNSASRDYTYNAGNLGNVLPNGDDYRENEVQDLAMKLLAEKR